MDFFAGITFANPAKPQGQNTCRKASERSRSCPIVPDSDIENMDVGHNVILHVVGQIVHSRPTALISFPSCLEYAHDR